MTDLHAELTALTVEWPATPDLAGAVLARLERAAPPRAASPSGVAARARLRARRAARRVRDHDGRVAGRPLGGARVARAQERQGRAPRADRAAALPGRAGLRARARHAGHAWPRRASARRSCACRRPTGSGSPTPSTSAARASRSSTASAPATRAPAARARRCSCRSSPPASEPFIEKTLGSAARLERLRVDGAPAYFIVGAHGFAYESDGGAQVRGAADRREHAAGGAGGRVAAADRGGYVARARGGDRAVGAVGRRRVNGVHRGERSGVRPRKRRERLP